MLRSVTVRGVRHRGCPVYAQWGTAEIGDACFPCLSTAGLKSANTCFNFVSWSHRCLNHQASSLLDLVPDSRSA